MEIPIQMNCLPLLYAGSKMDDGSEEWIEAYMFTHPMTISIR